LALPVTLRLIGLCLIAWSVHAMGDTARYALRITTEIDGDRLNVVPYVEASEAATLRYEMVSRKDGPAGSSASRQTGSIQVVCCAPKAASRLMLRVRPEDRYTITVRLFAGDRQVAEQTIRYP
jgi:hypothetical protein